MKDVEFTEHIIKLINDADFIDTAEHLYDSVKFLRIAIIREYCLTDYFNDIVLSIDNIPIRLVSYDELTQLTKNKNIRKI